MIQSSYSQALTQEKRICPYGDSYAKAHNSLFVIAKNWEQPKRPWTGEWINKMGNTHTME